MTRTLLSSAILITLLGCDNAEKEEPDEDLSTRYMARGAQPVGFSLLEHSRESSPLVVKAWYPASTDASEEITYTVPLKLPGFGGAEVPFLGEAVQGASPDTANGPYPLVVLSHGFSMNPEWYHPLAEHLASHGFVVLGPEHIEGDWAADIVSATIARPLDIGDTIDLAASGALDGVADVEHVAVVGHSYGGYAALAVAGARFDTTNLAERCEGVTEPFVASYFCDPFVAGEAELAALMALEEAPTGLWPSLRDERVDVIVPMAGDAYLFGSPGLAEVTIPAMVLGGTGDTGTPWDWGAGLTDAHIRSETRALVALEGAEHFIPATTCDHMPWTTELPEEYAAYFCTDPAWDKPEALDLINQLTTAFLRSTLTSDPAASDALDPSLYAEIEALDIQVSD